MSVALQRLLVIALAGVCVLTASSQTLAGVSAPFELITAADEIIVWQEFAPWLMITEDPPAGRICYYYNPANSSRIDLKESLPGDWMPLGSAIKWLMYIDHYQNLDRLMAHDVDSHAYSVAWPRARDQVGCGMIGPKCIFGQYRPVKVGDHYPVDLHHYDVTTGACVPFCISDSEKSQFAHDGELIVYRAYFGPSDARIYGHYFDGDTEFEIAARDGIEPSVCGSLVAWAEVNTPGFNIIAKDLTTGETRALAYTTADPPRPEAGRDTIFWQHHSGAGLDIHGYDWRTEVEFVVTDAPGDQFRLRACDDMVTWVTASPGGQTLWAAHVRPPLTVDDLRVSLVTQDSVTLSWTSVGWPENPPVVYDLRARPDAPITESNWATSTRISGLPLPSDPGHEEVVTVNPLPTGHYYFALKVRLSNGDYSLLSNCVCAYVSDGQAAMGANLGAYISFSGIVTGLSPTGDFYCQTPAGVGAVRASLAAGHPPVSVGDSVLVTGLLCEDAELCGPTLDLAAASELGQAQFSKPVAMGNAAVGGCDPRFGGTTEQCVSNLWMLVKTWGRVSGLVEDDGCSFYISDGSVLADNGGQGVYVVCPYQAPTGLADGSFVAVEGIARVSRVSGRQIEVVEQGKIDVLGP